MPPSFSIFQRPAVLDIVSWPLLAVFVPTFFLPSISPGLCMSLALTVGITQGLRRSLWMMTGELAGVALVCSAAVLGVAGLMLQNPAAFLVFKLAGGAYLAYLGIQLWRSRGRLAIAGDEPALTRPLPRSQLALQGFITATGNPKGWAFSIALLPPFIDPARPLGPQMLLLIGLILIIEFICLMIYANGGRALRRLLERGGGARLLNRIAGSLMLGVAAWLILG